MVKRPVLRYHGGKWKIGQWIIAQMPAHGIYVEPFGGAAGVLLQKPPMAAEIYNDLEQRVVSLFRVLQEPEKTERLAHRLRHTLYSRAEYERCYEDPIDDVDAAAKTIVLGFFGFGSDSITRTGTTGFRVKPSDKRALPAQAWSKWPEHIPALVARMKAVVIESVSATTLIKRFDRPEVLFYCDPPYVSSTRTNLSHGHGRGYRHEMNDGDHRELANVLHASSAMVMLSGYASPLYDELFGDWNFVRRDVMADGAKPRTECLWFNPVAWERRPQPSLYSTGGH